MPRIEKLGLPHSWDHFGRGDTLGTLNLLTTEKVAAAAHAVTTGEVIALSLAVNQPDPPLFGREPVRHVQFDVDRNTKDDRLDNYFPQGSSQWDGFYHVRAREFGFFGGVEAAVDPTDADLGIQTWARRGIVGRGVLLDVQAYLVANGHPGIPCDEEFTISADLLREVAESQDLRVEQGDILIIRTGWPAAYADRPHDADSVTAIPGLHAGEDTARLLWDWHVAAVVTDLPAVEPVPGDPAIGSLHRRLLPMLGIPLAELFDLEALSAACARAGRFDFLFTAAPLPLQGAAGSPGNALAIL
ncbi:cyclase [Cnuibacter physcomitrellae]|uniref:cyclase family protein n=1 Tax=Cnuibacter physcomitrellae TaxID=1619308 RepID=UPI0019AE0A77|nr:cyclase family protein [Cnuibacter physcomitrellae]GGI42562.1 cyclase [Cnuibacter physcomitrellae]